MDNNQIIEELSSLIKLDIDAVRAYDEAIEKLDEQDIRDQFSIFRDDHRRHIDNLSAIVSSLGGQPPKRSPDLKGFLIEGFTSLRSMTGTRGAVKAMETNEQLTNKSYADTLSLDLPLSISEVIQRNYNDEKRHLAYIEATLNLSPVAQ